MAARHARLAELIIQRALRRGEFVLASGKKASFYLDCRIVTLDGEGANLVAEAFLDAMDGDYPQAIGGMAIGADPITTAVVMAAWQRGIAMGGFIVRKEAKTHGLGRSVEGPFQPGQRCIVVEDTTTSGSSSITAIQRARDAGLVVDRAITLVDREQGASDLLAERGVALRSIFTLADLRLAEP